ncbi:MAG: gamma-glutamyl-gamma-aminobutyrate hydrolase family protein [Paraprevotella sp.]|nr:gamma-glutamyl-gamma-aminobutyrate hydrolase family protein [Paraprevotella sp.]
MSTDYFDWRGCYGGWHATFPLRRRRPVIGITGNYGEKGCELAEGYYRSLLRAGAVPLIVPPYEECDAMADMLERVDGLLLSGGGDLNPLFMGEEPIPELHSVNYRRDKAELLLIRMAYDRQVPMLGICRGIQMLTVALGGTLYQDIGAQAPDGPFIKHDQSLQRGVPSHTVEVCTEGILHRLFQGGRLAVNSFHHQAVREPGPLLRVCAKAPDGIVEAVESAEYKSVLGVQWHPECFIEQGDESMLPLFRWLTAEAASFAGARDLHRRSVVLDSHCDTPMFFEQGIRIEQRDSRILVDLHKMDEGGLNTSIMVAYLPQKERNGTGHRQAREYADLQLSRIRQMVEDNREYVGLACTPDDVYRLHREGRKAIMQGIENGYAIGRELGLLKHYRDQGVVYLTLCHNGDNEICDSARGQNEHGGLSVFGREAVAEMNRLGMMIDLSHASEKTFYDVLELSSVPVVCSHSSARALCDVPRNLTDAQMKALAGRGGVAQVTLYEGFLRKDGNASIEDVMSHLYHMIDVMGVEHVGIGTDFDGDGGVPGCAAANEVVNLTRRMLAEGLTEDEIRLIWGGNFLRVMREVQHAAVC